METGAYHRTTIYMTQSLYAEIEKRAAEQRRSLNSEVVSLVEHMLPGEPALRRHHKNNSNLKLIVGGRK